MYGPLGEMGVGEGVSHCGRRQHMGSLGSGFMVHFTPVGTGYDGHLYRVQKTFGDKVVKLSGKARRSCRQTLALAPSFPPIPRQQHW